MLLFSTNRLLVCLEGEQCTGNYFPKKPFTFSPCYRLNFP
uniref:Uncharacterized protein n=1 Tax=Anguilla anguilla TaxID=7936 RepID=A0A0E9WIL1_ANGAN